MREEWGAESPLTSSGAAASALCRIMCSANERGGAAAAPLFFLTPGEAIGADTLGMANFLREYGSRIYNAEKNTGAYAFAFNSFQRAFFPFEYRAPSTVLGQSKNS